MKLKLKQMMQTVEEYLTKHEHLRDDDNKLIASIWKTEIGSENSLSMSAFNFLSLVAENKLSNANTITRARRKLQELNPHLRGRKYYERMLESEKVRNDIPKI